MTNIYCASVTRHHAGVGRNRRGPCTFLPTDPEILTVTLSSSSLIRNSALCSVHTDSSRDLQICNADCPYTSPPHPKPTWAWAPLGLPTWPPDLSYSQIYKGAMETKPPIALPSLKKPPYPGCPNLGISTLIEPECTQPPSERGLPPLAYHPVGVLLQRFVLR